MCGILGSVNIPFNNALLNTIEHRGPDDSGMKKVIVNGNLIQLAQRRLAIVDLTPAGHQPMHSGCKCFTLVFNGEIYNHQELRNRLPKSIKYKGHSDTETILYYIKEFGIKGIKDFNGIFSIAILNRLANKLFLVRDPFGVKPLYYHIGKDNNLIFSSEMRPIEALLSKSNLNYQAMATLLRLRFNPAPDTLNENIKKIRPGHYLEIDLNRDQLVYNHHSFINSVPRTINYHPSVVLNLYGQKLENAVKRQLLSDVEIGVLLSGGIDSAVIAALAQKHCQGKLKAFTIGFEGDYLEDEISDAAETAQILGLEHHYKKISFTDFLTKLKECSRIVEEPLATTSIIPMYFLAELASKKVKVVLTGQGADEPLGGYARYKSELILNKIPGLLQNLILPIMKIRKFRNEKVQRGINVLGYYNDVNRFLVTYEVFSQCEIQKLINVSDYHSVKRLNYFYDLLDCKNKTHPVERMMALDTRFNLSDDLLNYTDKITMNFSMECRVPMLDLELVHFIESLPYDLKLNHKEGKLIHKRYAQSILPSKIINRKKKGFQSPTNTWFKSNSSIIKDLLLTEDTAFSKVFNQNFVGEIINQHQDGFNREKQIFLLLSIYFALESFEIQDLQDLKVKDLSLG